MEFLFVVLLGSVYLLYDVFHLKSIALIHKVVLDIKENWKHT